MVARASGNESVSMMSGASNVTVSAGCPFTTSAAIETVSGVALFAASNCGDTSTACFLPLDWVTVLVVVWLSVLFGLTTRIVIFARASGNESVSMMSGASNVTVSAGCPFTTSAAIETVSGVALFAASNCGDTSTACFLPLDWVTVLVVVWLSVLFGLTTRIVIF